METEWVFHRDMETDEELFWGTIFGLPGREEAAQMTGLECNCEDYCDFHKMSVDSRLASLVANPWTSVSADELRTAFNESDIAPILQCPDDELGWKATSWRWSEKIALLEKHIRPLFLTVDELARRHIRVVPGFYPFGEDPARQWKKFVHRLETCRDENKWSFNYRRRSEKVEDGLLDPPKVIGFVCQCCGKQKVAM